ncbi:hypothetical protein PLANPX_3672 [Lacipirellula parvula]|uniref:Uncharacterized protein n=2 Tax=Lacipirellula parvula TaxID=2650471 RepID=A0A5K7XBA2_9BACT|nr:hypothetical protein PLANPX_3672 [Lacipirellula parvula]
MIGQIIACPRCNMMVQVMAPAGYVPSAPAAAAPSPAATAPTTTPTIATHTADAPTATPPTASPTARPAKTAAAAAAVATTMFDASDALADVPAATPAVQTAPPATSTVVASTFDDAVDAFSDPPSAGATSSIIESAANIPSASATAPPPAPTTLPPTPSLWSHVKFPAMVAGGGLAGAAVMVGALSLIMGSADDPTRTLAPPAPVATTQPNGIPANPTAIAATEPVAPADPATVEPAPITDEQQPPVEPAAAAQTEVALADDPFAASPAAPADNQLAANVPAVPAPAESAEPAAAPADEAATAEPEAEKEKDEPRLRIDPLDIDPEGLSLSTLRSGPPKNPIEESQLPEQESAALSVNSDDAAGADQPAAEAPPAPDAVRRDQQAGAPTAESVAVLLERKTPQLKINNMPLCRLLDLSVQMSGIPISVAPEQLQLAAVSAGQPATAAVEDATILDFLAAALKPLRLQPVVVNDQIILIRGGNNPRRDVTYAVDDLAGDEQAIAQLAENIQKLVAPDTWQAAGGTGTLAVDGKQLKVSAGEAVQYDILLLLERSRAALEKPARSKYPSALIGGVAPAVALQERLGAPATFTFSQYTPLREIFRHWQEEMQVAVLVDWPALADVRLWPNTRIACSSSGTPWEAALDKVLEPLGLAWRPVDKRTIEITSLDKAAAEPMIAVYRLTADQLGTVEELEQHLKTFAESAGVNAPGVANVVDSEHSLLLARQPALVQREIAAWLANH